MFVVHLLKFVIPFILIYDVTINAQNTTSSEDYTTVDVDTTTEPPYFTRSTYGPRNSTEEGSGLDPTTNVPTSNVPTTNVPTSNVPTTNVPTSTSTLEFTPGVCTPDCGGCVLPCIRTNTSCYCSCIPGYVTGPDVCYAVVCPVDTWFYEGTVLSVNVTFPTTLAGYSNTTLEYCPDDTPNAGTPYGTRFCNISGMWQHPIFLSSCQTTIDSLANVTITTEAERQEVAEDLEVLTSDPDQLDSESVTSTVDVLEQVVDAPELTVETSASVISTISNLLAVPDEQLQESGESERLLQTLDSVGELVILAPGGQFQEVDFTVAVAVVQPTSQEVQLGIGFGASSLNIPDQVGFRSDQLQTFVQSPDSDVTSFIIVPEEAINQSQEKRVSFYAFPDDKLFQSSNSNDRPLVTSSVVLSATVVGANVTQLTDNVTIQFELNEEIISSPPANSKLVCAFWNESTNEWSQTGETPAVDDVTNAACSFDHLTNFAVLFALQNISPEHETYLGIITLVGCSLSLCGAILTIVVYVYVKRTSTDAKLRTSFLLTNYAAALALMNISIILSEVEKVRSSEVGCLVVSCLIHFSLLSVFGWMTSEAVNIYLTIIHPFFSRVNLTNRRVFVFSIVLGWGFPLVFVGTLVSVSRDYYSRDDLQCWLQIDYIIYFVTIPTGILLALNLIIYFVVVVRVVCLKRPKTSNKSRRNHFQNTRKHFVFSLTLFLTLGGTWVFGFGVVATDGDIAIAFAYLFTVFNSIQGFVLFLLFVVRHKNTRQEITQTFSGRTSKMSTTTNAPLPSWNKNSYAVKPNSEEPSLKIKLQSFTPAITE